MKVIKTDVWKQYIVFDTCKNRFKALKSRIFNNMHKCSLMFCKKKKHIAIEISAISKFRNFNINASAVWIMNEEKLPSSHINGCSSKPINNSSYKKNSNTFSQKAWHFFPFTLDTQYYDKLLNELSTCFLSHFLFHYFNFIANTERMTFEQTHSQRKH